MTKAKRILKLHSAGKTTREIAVAVSGLKPDAPHKVADRKMAYVRVVLRQRQRKGTGASKHDEAWRAERTRREREARL